ncbi:hypothetical protein [Demequina capsici]|uniref:Uncharacterized protein n=1 Tax=Demequina capsici TaxID=3075620 RepID=A0AA96J7B5_9MICO|nr:hypothetical protein [Demequina sp. OYTSA14]WNM24180.1 hypothetical protein RN606_12560 [Demequina sp. OYTSA14]
MRGPRFWIAWTVVLGLVVIGSLWALTYPWGDAGGSGVPSASATAPSVSSSDTSSPSPTATALPGLDDSVVAAMGEGWVVTTLVDGSGAVTLAAVDPSGGLYLGPVLPAGSRLLAMLADGRAVVLDPSDGTLRTVALATGDAASLGAGWQDPVVAVPAGADATQILVESGPAGSRTVDAVSTVDGTATRLGDAADRHGLVSSADGTTALTAIGSAPSSIVASTAGADDVSSGAPLGGSACEPEAWDADRQAIVVCADDQTTVWALEPTTATYASAATVPAAGGLAFAVSGSRILVAGSVYGIDGTLKWALPEGAAKATAGIFTGTALALWSPGDDGTAAQVVLVRPTGRLSGVVNVPDGYSGFVQVVAAG